MRLTKDMGIKEVIQKYPSTVPVLIDAGMGCVGCAAAHFENIEQGARAHGIDVDTLMRNLNAAAEGRLQTAAVLQRKDLFYNLCFIVKINFIF